MTLPRSSVSAVVCGDSPETARALQAQTLAVDHVIASPALAAGLLQAETAWVWVLDGSVAPEPTALEALLEGLSRTSGLPAPAILAGTIVDDQGAIDAAWAPWYRAQPTELAMSAVERHLVPIRASPGAVLVHRDVAARARVRSDLGPGAAVFEWTARILRSETGYWTAGCQSTLVGGAAAPTAGARAARALLSGGAFRGTERVRVALDLLGAPGARSARAQAVA